MRVSGGAKTTADYCCTLIARYRYCCNSQDKQATKMILVTYFFFSSSFLLSLALSYHPFSMTAMSASFRILRSARRVKFLYINPDSVAKNQISTHVFPLSYDVNTSHAFFMDLALKQGKILHTVVPMFCFIAHRYLTFIFV
jgi:hypothetical protein